MNKKDVQQGVDRKPRPGVPPPSSEEARKRMTSTGQRDTAAEKAVRALLFRMGLRYRVDLAPIKGLRRRADIVFTRAKVAVYIDGCFWHGCPIHATWPKANAAFWREKIETNGQRDRDTDRKLSEQGWRVLRFWEHEPPEDVARQIALAVRAPDAAAPKDR